MVLQGERQYWGIGKDGSADAAPGADPRGIREVSRACALEDEIRCQLASRIPPELVARLDAMQAAGGPAPAPPGELVAALHAVLQWCWSGRNSLSCECGVRRV